MKIELKLIQKEMIRPLFDIKYGEGADLEWLKFNGPYFRDSVPSWLEYQKSSHTSIENPHRKIILVDNEIKGELSAHWEDGELQKWLEMGVVIYKCEDWAKGIATTALREWILYLFELHADIEHLAFTTWSGNPGMIKVGEKTGMKAEGVIRKVRYWNEQYYDSVKFGILRSEV
ncbi:MAG: GNAT family N-acetyltransferase [Streptococcaceae bacterium]|nr:GNAT family N-acetyltransferase [Streptococcaceae bacterium]